MRDAQRKTQRKTWWNRDEIVAWIAFRKLEAVAAIRELKAVAAVPKLKPSASDRGRAVDPLIYLVADTALDRPYAKPGSWLDRDRHVSAGVLVRRAASEWSKVASEFVLKNGSARRTEIQKRWPPQAREGRGAGRSIEAHYDGADLLRIVERLIFTKRDMTRNELRHELCEGRYRRETAKLFGVARELACQRIEAGELRFQESDWGAVERLSPEQAEDCRANLKSWFSRTTDKYTRRSENRRRLEAAERASAKRQAVIDEFARTVEDERRAARAPKTR